MLYTVRDTIIHILLAMAEANHIEYGMFPEAQKVFGRYDKNTLKGRIQIYIDDNLSIDQLSIQDFAEIKKVVDAKQAEAKRDKTKVSIVEYGLLIASTAKRIKAEKDGGTYNPSEDTEQTKAELKVVELTESNNRIAKALSEQQAHLTQLEAENRELKTERDVLNMNLADISEENAKLKSRPEPVSNTEMEEELATLRARNKELEDYFASLEEVDVVEEKQEEEEDEVKEEKPVEEVKTTKSSSKKNK